MLADVATDQQRDAQRSVLRRLRQRRHRSLGLGGAHFSLGCFQIICQAGGDARLRQSQQIGFERGDRVRGCESALQAAPFQPVAADFGEHRRAYRALVLDRGLQIRVDRFLGPAYAAEQIDLPTRVEAELEQIAFRRGGDEARLHGGAAASTAIGSGDGVELGSESADRFTAQGARFADARGGQA